MGGKKEVITLLLFTDGDRDQITSLLSHRKPVAAQNRRNWDFLGADALTTNSLLPSLPAYFILTASLEPLHFEKGNVSFCNHPRADEV